MTTFREKTLKKYGLILLMPFIFASFFNACGTKKPQLVELEPSVYDDQPKTTPLNKKAISNPIKKNNPKIDTAVKAFIEEHPELGKLSSIENLPDWADGKRRQVTTLSGEYLFYFETGEVVTVYKNQLSGGRIEIFRKKIKKKKEQANYKIKDKNKSAPLSFKVLDKMKLFDGRVSADVLVPSASKKTPLLELKKLASQIMTKIGADRVSLYCSKKAMKASYSDSYAKKHPKALKKCDLGRFPE